VVNGIAVKGKGGEGSGEQWKRRKRKKIGKKLLFLVLKSGYMGLGTGSTC